MPSLIPYSKYTLDNVTWTPISASYYCDDCEILNLHATISVKVRLDSTDADSERTLFPGSILRFQARTRRLDRFEPGKVIAYAQSVSGAPALLVTFQ